jgi:hypothetical protein
VCLQVDGDHRPAPRELFGDRRVEPGVVQAAVQQHQRRESAARRAAHLVVEPQSVDVGIS